MKAIIHYHPDKQVEYDMEWRILTEEITKYLNVQYEMLKWRKYFDFKDDYLYLFQKF